MDKAKLEARRLAKREAEELAEIENEKSQPEVETLTISIEWKKSRTWGANPHATAEVRYKDGAKRADGTPVYFTRAEGFTCSGCGYDKESTVIAEIFNKFLSYKLYQVRKWADSETNHPYGIYYYGGKAGEKHESGYISKPCYNGGVGTSCYYKIGEFIGGRFEKIASGKTFDVFQYSDAVSA